MSSGSHQTAMSDRSPSPSLPAAIGLTALSALVMAYALLIVQQILLGLMVVTWLLGLYLLWRFLVALEALADAQQRIARQRESE